MTPKRTKAPAQRRGFSFVHDFLLDDHQRVIPALPPGEIGCCFEDHVAVIPKTPQSLIAFAADQAANAFAATIRTRTAPMIVIDTK